MADQAIASITGMEPMREGEHPVTFTVGKQMVVRIDYEMENFGDHGIGWFFVHGANGLIAKMSARAVAEVYYRPESTDG